MAHWKHVVVAACAFCVVVGLQSVMAQEPAGESAPPVTPAEPELKPGRITVAVLAFEAKDHVNEDLGTQISEILTALLAAEDLKLIDRQTLAETLEEQELTLTGLVDADSAVTIGHLVGAQVIITGRAFAIGDRTFITAKIIGTETSVMIPVMVKGKKQDDLGDLVINVGEQVAAALLDRADELIAAPRPADPVAQLREQLEGRDKPRIAVLVTEEHVARVQAAEIDPAVETELKLILRSCGFTVMDIAGNELAKSVIAVSRDPQIPWPEELDRVDVVIVGEAFSEYGTRIGNLISSVARAEINAIARDNGEILFAGRTTSRAVDLGENIAGKTALQFAGRELAIDLLNYFVAKLPELPKAAEGADE